jgi:hypothetical protein
LSCPKRVMRFALTSTATPCSPARLPSAAATTISTYGFSMPTATPSSTSPGWLAPTRFGYPSLEDNSTGWPWITASHLVLRRESKCDVWRPHPDRLLSAHPLTSAPRPARPPVTHPTPLSPSTPIPTTSPTPAPTPTPTFAPARPLTYAVSNWRKSEGFSALRPRCMMRKPQPLTLQITRPSRVTCAGLIAQLLVASGRLRTSPPVSTARSSTYTSFRSRKGTDRCGRPSASCVLGPRRHHPGWAFRSA